MDKAPLDSAFAALADPTRRAILARLSLGEASVGDLMKPFALTQPTISKHLKVLEKAGLIERGRDAQRRPRRLNPAGLKAASDWLEPFRKEWEQRFDNLDRHLAATTSRGRLNMPAAAAHPFARTDFSVDEAAHTIRFVRSLPGTPERAFAAWTDPRQVALWWDPTGVPLPRCEIDLRVGGAFAFVSRDHPEMPFSGVYKEISPPNRLMFDAFGAEGRVSLEPSGSGTEMIVEIVCANEAHLKQFVAMGVAAGTSATLDNLAAHLAA